MNPNQTKRGSFEGALPTEIRDEQMVGMSANTSAPVVQFSKQGHSANASRELSNSSYDSMLISDHCRVRTAAQGSRDVRHEVLALRSGLLPSSHCGIAHLFVAV